MYDPLEWLGPSIFHGIDCEESYIGNFSLDSIKYMVFPLGYIQGDMGIKDRKGADKTSSLSLLMFPVRLAIDVNLTSSPHEITWVAKLFHGSTHFETPSSKKHVRHGHLSDGKHRGVWYGASHVGRDSRTQKTSEGKHDVTSVVLLCFFVRHSCPAAWSLNQHSHSIFCYFQHKKRAYIGIKSSSLLIF